MTGSLRRASATGALALLAVAGWSGSLATVAAGGVVLAGLYRPRAPGGSTSHTEGIALIGAAMGLGAAWLWAGYPGALVVATLALAAYGIALEVPPSHAGAGVHAIGGAVLATVAGVVGHAAAGGAVSETLPELVVVAIVGGLVTTLVVDQRPPYRETVVVGAVAPTLWLFWLVVPSQSPTTVAVAVGVTGVVGYAAVALETASRSGVVTGVLLALLAVVLGGYGWFVALVAFFGIGGLATKYHYDEKVARGVAEDNQGARGIANVLGNAAVASGAVVAFAASETDLLAVDSTVFVLAFAGALATATADTLSSEVGSVYDGTRLITTFEPVDPGTDGGVTWQGAIAGCVGSAVIAGIAIASLPGVTVAAAVAVLVAGVAGMTADSIVGATLEGPVLGNQGVNFLATVVGAAVAVSFLLL